MLSASNLATFEAWQLSLWYQELGLLYLLDHNSEYRDRMAAEAVGESTTCRGSSGSDMNAYACRNLSGCELLREQELCEGHGP